MTGSAACGMGADFWTGGRRSTIDHATALVEKSAPLWRAVASHTVTMMTPTAPRASGILLPLRPRPRPPTVAVTTRPASRITLPLRSAAQADGPGGGDGHTGALFGVLGFGVGAVLVAAFMRFAWASCSRAWVAPSPLVAAQCLIPTTMVGAGMTVAAHLFDSGAYTPFLAALGAVVLVSGAIPIVREAIPPLQQAAGTVATGARAVGESVLAGARYVTDKVADLTRRFRRRDDLVEDDDDDDDDEEQQQRPLRRPRIEPPMDADADADVDADADADGEAPDSSDSAEDDSAHDGSSDSGAGSSDGASDSSDGGDDTDAGDEQASSGSGVAGQAAVAPAVRRSSRVAART